MKKIWVWAITAALAGFLFGFDTVVISGADKKLQALWGSSDVFHGMVVMAMALWGTIIGAIFGGIPTDKIGRKKTLFWIGILYTISALGSALSYDPYVFAMFRFLGGIGVGASTIAAPAYISEIAPAKDRGKLVGLYQFNIVFGILIAFFSNYWLNGIGENDWRWMMGVEAIPAIIYTLFVLSVPKSPRWLLSKLRNDEAREVLQRIDPDRDVEVLLFKIQEGKGKKGRIESIFQKTYRFPLILAFLIAFFNQLSGINAFLYYAPRIFEEAGLGESTALLSSIGIGVTNLVFTLLGVYLIDRVGRKQLMYFGSVGYIISLSLVSCAFFLDWTGLAVPIFLFLFIASHAVGQGAVIWVFISEIFPNHLRSSGQAFGSSVHWVLAAIIPSLIPVLFSAIGAGTVFAFFAFMMVLQLLFVAFIIPETKGISLEEASQKLVTKHMNSMISKSKYIPMVIALLMIGCKEMPKEGKALLTENKESEKIMEKFRPQFHFTPEENWMNDPNGLVYHNGYYHLFYQYYPDDTVWGPMHWGHAKSKDLLHWEHLPIALYPDSLGYIFSGSAVVDKNNTAGFGENALVAIFTYHNPEIENKGSDRFQTQGIAYSTDGGETWDKYTGNPVLQNPGIRDFRDPKVFWNDQKSKWQMVLAAKDHVQFYESVNLKDWSLISKFGFNDDPLLGVWECPDLFKLKVDGTEEEKWVLIVSHGGESAPNGGSGTRYFVGEYDGTTFTTDQNESQWLDYGTDNYAGVTYNNTPDQKRILIGWMSNWNYATKTPTEKWRSAMTLPRELELVKKNRGYLLKSKLIDAFEKMTSLVPANELMGVYPTGFTYEDLSQSLLSLDVSIKDSLRIELSNHSGDKYVMGYEMANGTFYLDRGQAGSLDFSEPYEKTSRQTMDIGSQEKLSLQIAIDASSIEIFINDGEYVMTTQVFPKHKFTEFKILNPEKITINDFFLKKVNVDDAEN